MSAVARAIDAVRREARRRVSTLILRGAVRVVQDALQAQTLQVELPGGDAPDDVEHAQPFGLSFRPTEGAEALVLSVGGDPNYPVAICVQDRSARPAADVEPGEGGLYADGAYLVFLAADGVLHLGEQSAADFVARADRVDERLRQLEDAFLEHVHPPITLSTGALAPILGPGVPPAASLTYVLNRSSTAADNVRAT